MLGKLLVVAWLVSLGLCFHHDEALVRKYAYMKVLSTCLGEEVVTKLRQEFINATMECNSQPVNMTNKPDFDDMMDEMKKMNKDNEPIYVPYPVPVYIPSEESRFPNQFPLQPLNPKRGQSSQQLPPGFPNQFPSQFASQFPPEFSSQFQPKFGSRFPPQFPHGFSPTFNPRTPQDNQDPLSRFPPSRLPPGVPQSFRPRPSQENPDPLSRFPLRRRTKRSIKSEEDLDLLKDAITAKINNMTCVLQKMQWISEDSNQLNFSVLEELTKNLNVSQELQEDLLYVHGICKDFSMCLPVEKAKHPMVKELGQVFAYMKCSSRRTLVSCMNRDIRKLSDKKATDVKMDLGMDMDMTGINSGESIDPAQLINSLTNLIFNGGDI